jgi:hypothetical protein
VARIETGRAPPAGLGSRRPSQAKAEQTVSDSKGPSAILRTAARFPSA